MTPSTSSTSACHAARPAAAHGSTSRPTAPAAANPDFAQMLQAATTAAPAPLGDAAAAPATAPSATANRLFAPTVGAQR